MEREGGRERERERVRERMKEKEWVSVRERINKRDGGRKAGSCRNWEYNSCYSIGTNSTRLARLWQPSHKLLWSCWLLPLLKWDLALHTCLLCTTRSQAKKLIRQYWQYFQVQYSSIGAVWSIPLNGAGLTKLGWRMPLICSYFAPNRTHPGYGCLSWPTCLYVCVSVCGKQTSS